MYEQIGTKYYSTMYFSSLTKNAKWEEWTTKNVAQLVHLQLMVKMDRSSSREEHPKYNQRHRLRDSHIH